MTYNAVHKRLRSKRGAAADYLCVDCGGGAAEWSLRAGSGEGAPRFSDDLMDYEPRCKSCHRKHDGGGLTPRNPFRTMRFDRANEANTQVRLSNEQVRQIRRKRATGALQKELAAEYGVDPSTISLIVNEKRRAL